MPNDYDFSDAFQSQDAAIEIGVSPLRGSDDGFRGASATSLSHSNAATVLYRMLDAGRDAPPTQTDEGGSPITNSDHPSGLMHGPSPIVPGPDGRLPPPELVQFAPPPEGPECYCVLTCEDLDDDNVGPVSCTLRLWGEVSENVRYPRVAHPEYRYNPLVGYLDLRDSAVDVGWEIRTSSDEIVFTRMSHHNLRRKFGLTRDRLSGIDPCKVRIPFAIEPSAKLLGRFRNGDLSPASTTITAYLNGHPCADMTIEIVCLDCDLNSLSAVAQRLHTSSPDPQVFAWVQPVHTVSATEDLGTADDPAPGNAVVALQVSFKATRSLWTVHTYPDCCCEYYFRGFAWATIDVLVLDGAAGAGTAARLAARQLMDFLQNDESLIASLRGLMTDGLPRCYRSATCPPPEPEDVADFSTTFFLTQSHVNQMLNDEEEKHAPVHQAECMAEALEAADNAQRQALSTNIHSKDRYDSYPFFCDPDNLRDLEYLHKQAPKSARGLGLSDVEALALSEAKDWQALLVIQTIADVKLDVVSKVVGGQPCCCIFISSMTFTLRAGLFHCYRVDSSVKAAKQLFANVWQPALELWKRADIRLADYVAPAVKLVGESQRCFTSQDECAQAVKDLSQLLADKLSFTYATTDNGPPSLCYYNCTLKPIKPGSRLLTEAELAECHRGCDDAEGFVPIKFPDPFLWLAGKTPEAIDPATWKVGSVAYQRGALGGYFLEEAERYNKENPGWYLPPKLPNCPLTNPDKGGVRIGDGWASEGANPYHDGAAECFRSDPNVFKYTNFNGAGQQCCYNEEGVLITIGSGAGTPDRVNTMLDEDGQTGKAIPLLYPIGNFGVRGHVREDVWPTVALNWELYNKFWPPNTGK